MPCLPKGLPKLQFHRCFQFSCLGANSRQDRQTDRCSFFESFQGSQAPGILFVRGSSPWVLNCVVSFRCPSAAERLTDWMLARVAALQQRPDASIVGYVGQLRRDKTSYSSVSPRFPHLRRANRFACADWLTQTRRKKSWVDLRQTLGMGLASVAMHSPDPLRGPGTDSDGFR